MDKARLIDVVPHYLAMLLLLFLVLSALRWTVGDLGFWIEVLILLAIAFLYRPIVIYLGIAPSSWVDR